MPKWLLPWVFPLVLTVTVPLLAVSTLAGAVVLVAGLGGLVVLRARHLKAHPPEAELVKKPFWKP